MYLCFYLSEDQSGFYTLGARKFWESEDTVTSPHNFKGLFEGQDLALGFKLEIGLV